jgi:hypothetical protein
MGNYKVYVQEMASKHLSGESVISSIRITVSTSDMAFAGTDAKVSFIFGSLANYQLNTTGEDDFEMGETRSYNFKTSFTLDEFRKAKLELGHDNTGKNPGWSISQVSIHILLHGSDLIYLYKHWGEIGWLAIDKAPFYATLVELQG